MLRFPCCLALYVEENTDGGPCEIQECIDAAYAGEEDYRQRVYIVGGYLNVLIPLRLLENNRLFDIDEPPSLQENPSILHQLLSGEATATRIALASPHVSPSIP